ncbi:MAG: ATP synthase F0 subunit B, partial [Cyanobacteria bacterium P01_H01_bin.74]
FFLILHSEAKEVYTLIDRILDSNLFNVLLVLLVLIFVAKKFNIISKLDQQTDQIANDVHKSERAKQAALSALEDAKKKMAGINEEIDLLMADSEKSAQQLADKIIEKANQDAEKIGLNTKKQIEMKKKSAALAVEQKLFEDSVESASGILNAAYNKDLQKQDITDFIEKLPDVSERKQ